MRMIAEEMFREEIPMATPGNHMLSPWQPSLGRNANVREAIQLRERGNGQYSIQNIMIVLQHYSNVDIYELVLSVKKLIMQH